MGDCDWIVCLGGAGVVCGVVGGVAVGVGLGCGGVGWSDALC